MNPLYHDEGWCSACSFYHRPGEVPPPTPTTVEDIERSAVENLVKRNPITGKIDAEKSYLSTPEIFRLLFSDGLEVWKALQVEEKERLKEFVREKWSLAFSKKEPYAVKFLGNILIRMNRGEQPVHGEYTNV